MLVKGTAEQKPDILPTILYLPQWKYLYFKLDFTEVCPRGPSLQCQHWLRLWVGAEKSFHYWN